MQCKPSTGSFRSFLGLRAKGAKAPGRRRRRHVGGGPSANRCVRWGRVARVCSAAKTIHWSSGRSSPDRCQMPDAAAAEVEVEVDGWEVAVAVAVAGQRRDRARAREGERNGATSSLAPTTRSSGTSNPVSPRPRRRIMSNEKNRAVVYPYPNARAASGRQMGAVPFLRHTRPAWRENGGKISRYAPRGHFLGPRGATGGPAPLTSLENR